MVSKARHLNLFVQIAQQEGQSRGGRGVADFLNRDQCLVHHLIVFGMQRFDQIRNRGAAAQNADGAAGVGAALRLAPAVARVPSASITSGRTST